MDLNEKLVSPTQYMSKNTTNGVEFVGHKLLHTRRDRSRWTAVTQFPQVPLSWRYITSGSKQEMSNDTMKKGMKKKLNNNNNNSNNNGNNNLMVVMQQIRKE